MRILLVTAALLVGTRATAQTARGDSPLWGDLVQGPHRVGFKTLKARDATRWGGAADTAARMSDRGYPLTISYWYPASPSVSDRTMTFGAYQSAAAADDQLRDPTPERIQSNDRALKAFYERAQNFPFGPVAEDAWARLGPTSAMAVADAPALRGAFPLIAGVGGPGGNFVLGEYLASHGYVVAIVGSPASLDLAPAAQMEWFVRDLEFAVARLRTLDIVDSRRIGTWGFSFAGMPALLGAMRIRNVAAVASLESGIFSQPFAQQIRGNPFYDPVNLRVPFLHMYRAQLSREGEQLDGFEALRYSMRYRYLLHDTTLVHQDFGSHGMAAAAVLNKRPAALAAAREAQVANAEYLRHFFDAYVKQDERAGAWLARTPEANGFSRGALTVEQRAARTPAPTARAVAQWFSEQGVAAAMTRLREAQRVDPEAAVFQEASLNALGYQLVRNSATLPAAVEVLTMNAELYPRSANVWDSLAEAYENVGDRARVAENARKTLDAIAGDPTLDDARREAFRRTANERIRKFGGPPAAPKLEFPSGMAFDAAGNIFVADRSAHVVFRIDARTNALSVFAGTGVPGRTGDRGPARDAKLRGPEWLEFDASGDLVLADRGNHVIRRIDRAGIITHVAGTGDEGQAGDGGPAATAVMTNPFGLTLDRAGNIFFFDTEAHAIRRIDARSGIVTTVIGNKQRGFSGDGGPATQAMLFRPHNGVFDRDGSLIFGDSFNQRIRRWNPQTGIIETIAGTGEAGSASDGTPARQAKFTFFGAMVIDRAGDLVFTSLDHRILKLDRRTNTIRVVAGTGVSGFSGDGSAATAAQFSTPYGLLLAPNGDLIIADAGNSRIRRIEAATGIVRTIAGDH